MSLIPQKQKKMILLEIKQTQAIYEMI